MVPDETICVSSEPRTKIEETSKNQTKKDPVLVSQGVPQQDWIGVGLLFGKMKISWTGRPWKVDFVDWKALVVDWKWKNWKNLD